MQNSYFKNSKRVHLCLYLPNDQIINLVIQKIIRNINVFICQVTKLQNWLFHKYPRKQCGYFLHNQFGCLANEDVNDLFGFLANTITNFTIWWFGKLRD